MDRLRRSTEEITADRLDRRLPVANPRDELGRLTQTLNAMVGRLERSFAEVRRFTAGQGSGLTADWRGGSNSARIFRRLRESRLQVPGRDTRDTPKYRWGEGPLS